MGKNIYSQNGEDGVIEKIFEYIGTTNKFFVEFGVGDGTECNTRLLREKGWHGLWMDGVYSSNHQIKTEIITAENINSLFSTYNVPYEFDLLSIDIDGNDYWVYKAISPRYSPRVIVVEYNASYPPPQSKTVVYDPSLVWRGTDYFGATLSAWHNLLSLRGYCLIGCESRGVNAFFVRGDSLSNTALVSKTPEEVFVKPGYGRVVNHVMVGHPHDTRRLKEIDD